MPQQQPPHPFEFDPDTGERVRPPAGDVPPQQTETELPDVKPDTIDCKQCGGTMIRARRGQHNIGMQLLGVVGFLLGLVLLAFFWPLGLVLIVASLFAGYKKVKGWHCQNCGYFFETL